MNTREIAAEYRLAHWAQIMQERKESGLSIKAFCETAGYHENIYYYWQRKLRETAYQELQSKPQKEVDGTVKPLVPSGWAVCETKKDRKERSPVFIEIGPCRITATADIDQELLTKICRVLMALC